MATLTSMLSANCVQATFALVMTCTRGTLVDVEESFLAVSPDFVELTATTVSCFCVVATGVGVVLALAWVSDVSTGLATGVVTGVEALATGVGVVEAVTGTGLVAGNAYIATTSV